MVASSSCHLYAGERLEEVSGFPTLYKFSPADPERPLVVFVPGGAHNSRIAYGGHPDSRQEDFLAYWLNKLGYGLLSISYPLESEPREIMPPVAPGFRISDWGRQAAEVTRLVVDRRKLSHNVVLVAWSMGGRVVIPYTRAAKALGLTVELFVALSATPGFDGARPPPPGVRQTAAGYGTFDKMSRLFLEQMHVQNCLHGRTIIPDDIYLRDYYGHTPVSLAGWGLRYSPGQDFERDQYTSTHDASVDSFDHWPPIAALHGDDLLDARHVLADKATWAFFQTHRLVSYIEARGLHSVRDRGLWNALTELVNSFCGQMSSQIHGSHYFFVGEQGARETAEALVRHLEQTRTFMSTLDSLITPST